LVQKKVLDIFKKSFQLHRFPAFCGVTIGGWHILQPVFEKLLHAANLSPSVSSGHRRTLATFLASSIAAAGGICLLNSRANSGPAGRTLDLTLFAVVRALDVVVGELWARRRDRRVKSGTFTRMESAIGSMADPALFAASAAMIMFSWIYEPEKLPSYDHFTFLKSPIIGLLQLMSNPTGRTTSGSLRLQMPIVV
jgi:hypothetical protein